MEQDVPVIASLLRQTIRAMRERYEKLHIEAMTRKLEEGDIKLQVELMSNNSFSFGSPEELEDNTKSDDSSGRKARTAHVCKCAVCSRRRKGDTIVHSPSRVERMDDLDAIVHSPSQVEKCVVKASSLKRRHQVEPRRVAELSRYQEIEAMYQRYEKLQVELKSNNGFFFESPKKLEDNTKSDDSSGQTRTVSVCECALCSLSRMENMGDTVVHSPSRVEIMDDSDPTVQSPSQVESMGYTSSSNDVTEIRFNSLNDPPQPNTSAFDDGYCIYQTPTPSNFTPNSRTFSTIAEDGRNLPSGNQYPYPFGYTGMPVLVPGTVNYFPCWLPSWGGWIASWISWLSSPWICQWPSFL